MPDNNDKPKKVRKKKQFQHHLTLRNATLDDYGDIKEIMDMVYSNMGGAWTKRQFAAQISRFPEGQICIEDNGKVVATALSMIVDYSKFGDNHTYWQITGRGFITNHDSEGDTLYGIDVFVHPKYQNLRLGRRLYDARKELCEKLNLKRIIAGGRIPGYKKYSEEMSPQRYIEMVKNKEILDPILTFQMANDFHVRKVLTNYLPSDDDSMSYATLLEWLNIYYHEKEELFGGKKTVVRVGSVQWQMRDVSGFEELMKQVEFFVDAVAGYKADFVLFPEFFNAAMMARANEKSAPDAIRFLAGYTEKLKEKMLELAVSYNINIIAGSVPEYKNHILYNVSFLCRRDGTWDKQYKLHVTKDEGMYWGLRGGDELKVFETDVGKIGILVCYDVEFPELSRIMAEKGMNILFVPYWTDTKNAYLRVRRCAQARAVENECYVVITGSVGNLPDVENMDIQYSQSAVFSPSDFAFPHDAIVAEATPNTEMTLLVDLDLDLLKDLRVHGSVTNLRDRRHDIYKIVVTDGKSENRDDNYDLVQ
jgi:predicted amidohydrolase/ribosomal protein S18 acetylase RimI-like enzyme